ncbi:unnamed protein product [Trichobilharzia regenti]|nr:unnamed protein product [Trichobilharzia regenti]
MSRFTTASSSLSSFRPNMLSENVYFSPLLSYSSTLAIFNELTTKLNKQSDFMQTNNALMNTILPEIDYSLPHTTTTTTNNNNNNNNTSNVTYSGSAANDFKSFYARPIMNQTALSFNDRNNKSDKQIELLEKTYQMDRYVSRPQRTKLSNELDLPENTIKVSNNNVS